MKGAGWIGRERRRAGRGAAAYAIRAVVASTTPDQAETARLRERDRQRAQLPAAIRDLVLDDQRLRSAICWNVFDD